MKHALIRVAPGLVGIFTAVVALSACSSTTGRWFEGGTSGTSGTAAPSGDSPNDLKLAAVKYVRDLCAIPREQRDPVLQDLNESLLPNHAVISCGRAGTSDSPR
jgi:hypothetical protein